MHASVRTCQPLASDAMFSPCWVRSKLQRAVLKDVPATVWQELMTAPILAFKPLDVRQAMEELKATSKVVMQSLPQSHATKPPPASSSAKQLFASLRAGPSRGRDKSLTSKEASSKSQSFRVQHHHKQESSSSRKSFSRHSLYKNSGDQ